MSQCHARGSGKEDTSDALFFSLAPMPLETRTRLLRLKTRGKSRNQDTTIIDCYLNLKIQASKITAVHLSAYLAIFWLNKIIKINMEIPDDYTHMFAYTRDVACCYSPLDK